MTRPPYETPSEADIAIVSEQLGREARGVVGIAARAADGTPAVVATAPRLPDGSPFPTFYYLCHPEAVAAASRLEASGTMVEFNELLATDADVRAQYERAHAQYIEDRDSVGEVPEIAGVSAGGMPTRVKCLHALIGHALAAGPGVNPIGDLALARGDWHGYAQTEDDRVPGA
ncbi:DUF501 domain-containing protein [Leucobacter sp. GX24907]